MGFWAVAGPALAGIAGDVIGGLMSSNAQAGANRMNLKIAREQMAFQERMSSTAYQRAVQDLKTSGLNPMLASMNGGASSPPGASAQMIAEDGMGRAVQRTGDRISSAIQSKLVMEQVKQAEAQTKTLEAGARKTNAEAALVEAEVPWSAQNAQSRADKLKSEMLQFAHGVAKAQGDAQASVFNAQVLQEMAARLRQLEIKYQELGLPAAKAESDFWEALPEAAWVKKLREVLPRIEFGRK